jgi:hypothetical protein
MGQGEVRAADFVQVIPQRIQALDQFGVAVRKV